MLFGVFGGVRVIFVLNTSTYARSDMSSRRNSYSLTFKIMNQGLNNLVPIFEREARIVLIIFECAFKRCFSRDFL